MRKTALRAALLGVALLAPTMAQAQIIDQQQTSHPNSISSVFGVYQDFNPSKSNINGAGVWVINATTQAVTGTLSVYIDGTEQNSFANDEIGPLDGKFTIGAQSAQWVDVFFTAYALAPSGDTFQLSFVSDNSAVTFGADNSNPYNASTGTYDVNGDGHEVAGTDLAFREYYDPEFVASPEPASMVLLGTGLLGVFGAARRRRNKTV